MDDCLISPSPTSVHRIRQGVKNWIARHTSGVIILDSAGPKEFVKTFAEAEWVISNSFHALMFSCIFERNVRILAPKTNFRKKMFARIEEIASHMEGKLVVDSIADALKSFVNGESVFIDEKWRKERVNESYDFLKSAIASCHNKE